MGKTPIYLMLLLIDILVWLVIILLMKSILITDSLFIFPEHEQQLRDAVYEVVRLDKPEASRHTI
jgi:hypothetical protein